MRATGFSYHQKFSAEFVFSPFRGRTSPFENCHFDLHSVQWQFTAARTDQVRDPLVKLFAGFTDRRRTTQGKLFQMPITNLTSLNQSLRAIALAVAAIVFLAPMVAQAGSRPCVGAHCKPTKPVVTKTEKPTVSGLNPRRPMSQK